MRNVIESEVQVSSQANARALEAAQNWGEFFSMVVRLGVFAAAFFGVFSLVARHAPLFS